MTENPKLRLPSLLCGKRTPERVKAILRSCHRKATNAQIAAWCHRTGRWPKTAEKLADLVTHKI